MMQKHISLGETRFPYIDQWRENLAWRSTNLQNSIWNIHMTNTTQNSSGFSFEFAVQTALVEAMADS